MTNDRDHIRRVGRVIAEYRGVKGRVLTQEKLAEQVGLSRTDVAHLEEGRELLRPEKLREICVLLEVPDRQWVAATHPFYLEAMRFEGLLCEFVGRPVSLEEHDGTDQMVALDRIQQLLREKLTETQSRVQFNSLLTFYGERPVTDMFFAAYLGANAFSDMRSFEQCLRRFQADAMRLYGNFRRAWTQLSRCPKLAEELLPLQSRGLAHYETRTSFLQIDEISAARLPDLGYIAVQRIEKEYKERSELSQALHELAARFEKTGSIAAADLSEKRLRRLRTLLRQFDSPLQLEESLFSRVNEIQLKSEAKRVAPAKRDLAIIQETQQRGLKNLAVYLSEPYMDVYVATSMREDCDFVSVNRFAKNLFTHPKVAPLKLRYFNPTQSWVGDRVAKGLVEALMLRRACVAVYMAQKGDTFGKDSEASVALGQGKTVIVYAPRLYDQRAKIDSEELFSTRDGELDAEIQRRAIDADEGLDQKEKAALVLRDQFAHLTAADVHRIIHEHWADFDLIGELGSVENDHLRKACAEYLTAVSMCKQLADVAPPEPSVRGELTDRMISVAQKFETRAKTFRDIHPLSLQVIVRSGVLNGILVTRSVDSCAALLRSVFANEIDAEVEVDEYNYRLVERSTRSTLRVVSRHQLLTNAFWTQYFEVEAGADSPLASLPAGTL
jgi:transcriptional regulator with XRE-family HTH domain